MLLTPIKLITLGDDITGCTATYVVFKSRS